jgi:hypothetical protein
MTTAVGATGFMEDFESPHAAANSAPLRISDQTAFDVFIGLSVIHGWRAAGDVTC